MSYLLRTALMGLFLSLALTLGQTAGAAPLSTVLIERQGGTANQHATGGRFPIVTVDRPIAITAMAEWIDIADGQEIAFVFYKKVGALWVEDRAPIVTTSGIAAGPAYEQSPSFSPYILEPGQSYALGLVSSAQHFAYYSSAPRVPTNGVSLGDAVIFQGFSPLIVSGDTSFNYSIKLIGYEVAPVPTLSEWAMILIGLAMAGGAALSLRRRKAA